MVTQIEETPIADEVQEDVFAKAEIASNLGKKIKENCHNVN